MLVTCRICGDGHDVGVSLKQYIDWRHSNKLIQNCFPALSADHRELLMSGVCGACFRKMFPPDYESRLEAE